MSGYERESIFQQTLRIYLAGLGFVLVGLIGIVDYLTGPIFSSLVFYLVLLFLSSGLSGGRRGLDIHCKRTHVVLTDMIWSPSHPNFIIPFGIGLRSWVSSSLSFISC